MLSSFGSCAWVLPNMGHFTCFLGAEYNQDSSFFSSSEFLYFYLIISIIVVTNSICFVITGYFLIKHWNDVKSVRNSNVGNTAANHVLVVLKIFLIMGTCWYMFRNFTNICFQACPGSLKFSPPVCLTPEEAARSLSSDCCLTFSTCSPVLSPLLSLSARQASGASSCCCSGQLPGAAGTLASRWRELVSVAAVRGEAEKKTVHKP